MEDQKDDAALFTRLGDGARDLIRKNAPARLLDYERDEDYMLAVNAALAYAREAAHAEMTKAFCAGRLDQILEFVGVTYDEVEKDDALKAQIVQVVNDECERFVPKPKKPSEKRGRGAKLKCIYGGRP